MNALVKALVDLNEKQVLSEAKAMRERGVPVREILHDLQEGMRFVGEQFECQNYYLPELILSAKIFKQAIQIFEDALVRAPVEAEHGIFIIGTVAGDIHDIGKNIVATILGCQGFKVVDLGVNVPADKFIEAINEYKPRSVGLSCLLTTAFDSMKATVEAIEKAGLRKGLSILIGGAPVTQATRDYVGADAFCLNAYEAVETARRMKV